MELYLYLLEELNSMYFLWGFSGQNELIVLLPTLADFLENLIFPYEQLLSIFQHVFVTVSDPFLSWYRIVDAEGTLNQRLCHQRNCVSMVELEIVIF